jgi:hypothetical protein
MQLNVGVRPPAIKLFLEISTLNGRMALWGGSWGDYRSIRVLNGLNLLKACGLSSCLRAQLAYLSHAATIQLT